jgi:hypothetical protein
VIGKPGAFPRRSVITRRRAVAGLIAGMIGLAGPAATIATAQSAGAVTSVRAVVKTGDDGVLDLKLTKITPSAVDPASDLVVTGTAHNSGSQLIKDVEIALRLRTQRLENRAAISTWLKDGEVSSYDSTLSAPATFKAMPAGSTKKFTIRVAAGQTGLSGDGSAFGPRAIALVAKDGNSQLGVLRSTIVWAPTEVMPRTRLSLLVPITSTQASNEAGQPSTALATSLTTDGHLKRVLDATGDPAISWAVDPAVLAATDRMSDKGITAGGKSDSSGATPSDSASSSPDASASGSSDQAKTAAATWLAQFRSGQNGREVFGLPFADPDLSSLMSVKETRSLLQHSDTLGKQVTNEVLGSPLDTTVAWPGDGRVNSAGITALRRTGLSAVLLPSSSQVPSPAVDYTPSGHSVVKSKSKRTLTGLLYDEDLSGLFTGGGSIATGTVDAQTLLAELAAISLERPDDTRRVLAVAPRTWNPSPAATSAMMTALHDAPWVSMVGISSLRKAESPPRAGLSFPAPAANSLLPVGQMTGALAASRNLDVFAPVLKDPDTVLQPLREQIASLLSVAWRNNRTQMSSQRQAVATNVSKLTTGVQLLSGGSYFTTARSPQIPLTVNNETDYPVHVIVRLRPQSAQLRILKQIVQDVPAHSRTPVLVPTRSIANGDVVVEGKLLSSTNLALGPSIDFSVRMRPNWESRGMVGAVSVLGLLLVVGLLRSFRRRRRPRVPLDTVPDVDELATQRADEAAAELSASSVPSGRPTP